LPCQPKFPEGNGKGQNEFSMARGQRRPKNERKLNRDEKKDQQQNPFSETSL
jgi:hypothetical protein